MVVCHAQSRYLAFDLSSFLHFFLHECRQKRIMRMRVFAESAKKVRSECRKQLAETRPRVRGRFAKVNSSDALMDFAAGGVSSCGGQLTGSLPATSSENNIASMGSVVSRSACTASPGATFHGASGSGNANAGWGHHGHGNMQPHMQRIDEEVANEGQSLTVPAVGAQLFRRASSTGAHSGTVLDGCTFTSHGTMMEADALAFGGMAAEQASAQQQQPEQDEGLQQQKQLPLKCAQNSSLMETDGLMAGSNIPDENRTTISSTTAAGVDAGGPLAPASAMDVSQQDCVITEHDLAALGVFGDFARMSQDSHGNAGNVSLTTRNSSIVCPFVMDER